MEGTTAEGCEAINYKMKEHDWKEVQADVERNIDKI